MSPEPANCPVCGAAAERLRAAPRGYRYTCPSCGTFQISSRALSCRPGLPASAREDIRRLRAYGHLPLLDLTRDGVSISPGRP